MQITHANHYVPKWLQKRFFQGKKDVYFYCDLTPGKYRKSDGNYYNYPSITHWPSTRCFKQTDLYTRILLGEENDDIERHLFGRIDDEGAISLPIVLEGDVKKDIGTACKQLLEFMDAQKLRTPRTLNSLSEFLKSQSGEIIKNDILNYMLRIRKMHLTIWGECEWEIVSAADSNIKFIITDQPITLYNPKCYPLSKYCKFPNSPEIGWLGTRTIFPLDLNHCLILTNLEYAKNYKKCNAIKLRTNARHFQPFIFDWTKIIRGRLLKDNEVISINYIMKMLATRYIAASEKEFLYPEKMIKNPQWSLINLILLPDRKKISRAVFHGIGYSDGVIYGSDLLGRSVPNIAAMMQDVHKMIDEFEAEQAEK